MLENEMNDSTDSTDSTGTSGSAAAPPRRRRAASRPAGPPVVAPASEATVAAPSAPAVPAQEPSAEAAAPAHAEPAAPSTPPARSRSRAKKAAPHQVAEPADQPTAAEDAPPAPRSRSRSRKAAAPAFSAPAEFVAPVTEEPTVPAAATLLFKAPELGPVDEVDDEETELLDGDAPAVDSAGESEEDADDADEDGAEGSAEGAPRKRRRRGGRGRRRRPVDGDGEGSESGEGGAPSADASADTGEGSDEAPEGEDGDGNGQGEGTGTGTRRRRRRRRGGASDGEGAEESDGTVVHVREPREQREPREAREPREPRSRGGRGGGGGGDEVTGLRGSTRLEAKKQRRREGRDAGRRRPPILSEAEFLSRREAVNRVMVIRQRGDLTQIAVLEDNVLVEHYVASASSSTMVGNVYLGKVQNVLPSMEAAFIDIGRGRNAVLYAGEVNWDAAALDGQPRRIEHVLKSGDSVLAQVTKDPMGHKGSRLTSNVSLAGRFLVYVPDGSMSGISRKLPDKERTRLKGILKTVVPEDAGVIVRTAAEGATEEQLTHDVHRLQAQWEDIEKKAKTAPAPSLLYGEPDLTVRVVRDLFNEDFDKLVVSGNDAWEVVEAYVGHVAPDLMDRVEKYVGVEDVFAAHRIDEQIAKGMDRKVWLPSGGSLVIDRTEAMTVVDVNTGKFVGKGSGNLEETVTRNNLEAAEEIVRQLRLRDIGGIIVIDFIDMVLESNRDLVLRRLTECLGRDRTKHQVAEVTSLGLVQMTRKRVGQGLIEAFSEPCEVCQGRGIKVHLEPVVHRGDHAGSDRQDRPERTDKVERLARVAKASKTAKAAPAAEPTDSAESAESADSADSAQSTEADKPVKAARTRQPRAPRAAVAPEVADAAPEAAEAAAVEESGEADAVAAEASKPPARRRRVAKKAQGAPAPAPAS
jgi:ribonuclease E